MANPSNTVVSPYSKISNSKSDQPMDLSKRRRLGETIIQAFLFFCGALSIFTTIGIVYGLAKESLTFFTRTQWEDTNKVLIAPINAEIEKFELSSSGGSLQIDDIIRINEEIMVITGTDGDKVVVVRGAQNTTPIPHTAETDVFQGIRVTLLEFFSSTKWNPQIGQFGIWPLLTSTLMTSLSAMLVALPLGLSVAIYLSEYASERSRAVLKPILEILAGIPTVVYGYFALTFMTPLLRSILGKDVVEIYNTASAGIVIGILIFPYVSSMSEDALHAVPRSLREA
jgi:ABC-type phosphate transport system permease subunit